jgi:tetratricopeptide (TPR) repeat protein
MMLVILFFAFAVWVLWQGLGSFNAPTNKQVVPAKTMSPRLTQLLDYAGRLYKEKKVGQAEKAYLEVLKYDHKNVVAYTRLGMIYSRQKNFDDAIECFQIAAQMQPTASSHHNLGLVYFENKNYIKAISSFEKAIIFEPSAARYISLAKAAQKMGSWPKVVAALEKAVEIDPGKDHLWLLAEAHRSAGNRQQAEQTLQHILELDPTDAKAKRILTLVTAGA